MIKMTPTTELRRKLSTMELFESVGVGVVFHAKKLKIMHSLNICFIFLHNRNWIKETELS